MMPKWNLNVFPMVWAGMVWESQLFSKTDPVPHPTAEVSWEVADQNSWSWMFPSYVVRGFESPFCP